MAANIEDNDCVFPVTMPKLVRTVGNIQEWLGDPIADKKIQQTNRLNGVHPGDDHYIPLSYETDLIKTYVKANRYFHPPYNPHGTEEDMREFVKTNWSWYDDCEIDELMEFMQLTRTHYEMQVNFMNRLKYQRWEKEQMGKEWEKEWAKK